MSAVASNVLIGVGHAAVFVPQWSSIAVNLGLSIWLGREFGARGVFYATCVSTVRAGSGARSTCPATDEYDAQGVHRARRRARRIAQRWRSPRTAHHSVRCGGLLACAVARRNRRSRRRCAAHLLFRTERRRTQHVATTCRANGPAADADTSGALDGHGDELNGSGQRLIAFNVDDRRARAEFERNPYRVFAQRECGCDPGDSETPRSLEADRDRNSLLSVAGRVRAASFVRSVR